MNETTTWYQIARYGRPLIVPVEVVKESAMTVVVRERWCGSEKTYDNRHHKDGEYFKTFQEAKDYLLTRTDQSIQNNRDTYSQLIQKRREIEALAAPKEGQ